MSRRWLEHVDKVAPGVSMRDMDMTLGAYALVDVDA